MQKKIKSPVAVLFGFALLCVVTSCKKDAVDDYVPLNILLENDQIQLYEDETLRFSIFSNDTFLPEDAVLEIDPINGGVLEIQDPNQTPENSLDDVFVFTPDGSVIGSVSTTYTVCDAPNRSCATATIQITILQASPVAYNLEAIPYDSLSEYNFFEGNLAQLNPVHGVLPYKPINALFTDYAHKKRFVWMPRYTNALYNEDYSLFDFPVGTILIKNFFYENVQPANTTQIIETRLLIKKADGWEFANYVWNEAQTEATYTLDGSFVELDWVENGTARSVNYRIPGRSECLTCHKAQDNPIPIGVKPQNLNSEYAFEDGTNNQLSAWEKLGYLDSFPASIETVANWQDTSLPIEDRVRGYVDINCAHCHTEFGHCDYRPLRLAFYENHTAENLGVCVDPDTPLPGLGKLVEPRDPENSVLYYRINTTDEAYRMPLLGRTLIHDEGAALIENWIQSLNQTCN